MTKAAASIDSYRFRSPARLDQARADLLQWFIAHQGHTDAEAAFDRDAFLAHLPPDGPLHSALDSLSQQPETYAQALGFLRSSIHLSEQQWPPHESFEATLAAALTAQVQSRALATSPATTDGPARPGAVPDDPAQEQAAPRKKMGLLKRLVLICLLALAVWGGLRFVQNVLERMAITKQAQIVVPTYQTALSNLATSLPAYASICLSQDDPCLPQSHMLLSESTALADLQNASESAGHILFALAPLDPQDIAHWGVTPIGENCLAQTLSIDSDHQLVSNLCRTRERLGEYQLCLSGHPVLSDRQCRDLLRLATVDTVFDCDGCGARPANVFDQRLEWRRELTAAAQLGTQLSRLTRPITLLRATWADLQRDWHAVSAFAATLQTGR